MVIFTIDHVPWNLKLILIPQAHIQKITNLLKEEMRREYLLTVRIQQLKGRPEDMKEAVRYEREARFRNEQWFDKKHRLQPRKIKE
jgi:hypothetical protein